MLRFSTDEKCGQMWAFPHPVVEDLNTPLTQFNNMKIVDWPGGDNNISCDANSTCGQQTFLAGPFGGTNVTWNPYLSQDVEGMGPASFLPYNANQPVSAGKIIRDLVKSNENLANEPWNELSSFEAQRNLVKDNPILSLQ